MIHIEEWNDFLNHSILFLLLYRVSCLFVLYLHIYFKYYGL